MRRIAGVQSLGPTRYGNSLAFLLSQVGARSAQLFGERLALLGVTPRAFGVLSNLAAREGQTQQELANSLGIHRNNMVGLIDELESASWVRRRRSSTDRRAFEIQLTAAGRALVTRANDQVPVLDEELARGLNAGQREQLRDLLGRIARTLELSPAVHPHLASRTR
jgi:DNA-binding MarR family transcriptional regulator